MVSYRKYKRTIGSNILQLNFKSQIIYVEHLFEQFFGWLTLYIQLFMCILLTCLISFALISEIFIHCVDAAADDAVRILNYIIS